MEYEKGIETGIIEEINPLNEYLDNIISARQYTGDQDRGFEDCH